jgi:hypothetical protein
VLLILFAALAACDGDDITPPGNRPPVAEFGTPACAGLVCSFTDASTDPDGNATIMSREWDFGGAGTSSERNPTHTFPAPGSYDVLLVVTDDHGESDDVTHAVEVAENVPPAASFTVDCISMDCTFTDTSTDPDGSLVAWEWDFGEPDSDEDTSTVQHPVHTYADSGYNFYSFWVRFAVTDNAGATSREGLELGHLAPPATCDHALCDMTLETDARVTITLPGECSVDIVALVVTSPVTDTVLTEGCTAPEGTRVDLGDGAVYPAGTRIELKIPARPHPGGQYPPLLRASPSAELPGWSLEYDAGYVEIVPRSDIFFAVIATPEPGLLR